MMIAALPALLALVAVILYVAAIAVYVMAAIGAAFLTIREE